MTEYAYIVGTNAEFIKMFPLMKELDGTFIHTGQHNLSELIETFGAREPDVVLSPPPEHGKTSKFMGNPAKATFWNLGGIVKIGKLLRKERPDIVIYHGDTMSTAAASIAAKNAKIKATHVEAGLRSHYWLEPFPEEIFRKEADKNANLLLAPSKLAVGNLESEVRKGKAVFNTGNTIVDAAMEAYKLGRKVQQDVPKEEYAILTFHRFETLNNRAKMTKIVEMVEHVSIPVYFFAHDPTIQALKRFGLWKRINQKVKAARFANYVSFIRWLAGSRLLFTDGGSIQEESLVFKKPCFLLRNRTERMAGLTTGLNFLTRFDVEFTKSKIDEVLRPDWSAPDFVNPYGEHGASKRVADRIKAFSESI